MTGRCRSRLAREDGQGMIEFALVLPVFLLLLVGLIEFGSAYSHIISMRQGIREAGRQGSVANWGSTSSCTLTNVQPPDTSDDIKKLMCFAKDQAGVGDDVRIRVAYADETVTPPFHFDPTFVVAGKPIYSQGNSIVVCAIYPVQSLTGIMQPFLKGHVSTTKAAFRIEQVTPAPVGTGKGGSEDPPTGSDWNFCPAS